MSSSIIFNGFSYGKNKENGNTFYYRCSRYSSGCKARLIRRDNIITEKGFHTCGSQIVSLSITNPDISATDYINRFLSDKSSQLNLGSSNIYRELLLSLSEKYVNLPYTIPSKSSVYSTIRNNRGIIGMNQIEAVISPPLSLKANGQPFFRRYWVGDIHGKMHRIIIWVTNESLALMRYNTHTFIDGTFKVTPHPFYQCVIVMIYDLGTELYVPCAFALVTGKSEYIYCELFHQLIMIMEYNWMPKIITTDFEKALISAVKQEFPDTKILGCYFHLKQALHRKLKKYHISTSNLTVILQKIELLTIIPSHQIPKAIDYIKSLLVHEEAVDTFWSYFEKTWLVRFPSNVWNNFDISQSDLMNRTNNGLERYNRRMNDFFANAHPNLCSFAEIIRDEFKYYDQRCAEIRQNCSGINYHQVLSENNDLVNEFNSFLNRN